MNKSQIDGLTMTVLRQIHGEQGDVLHMLRSDAPDFSGFGECYFSEILPGSIKAWKRHRLQTQNLAVPIGRLRLAIYDSRDESRSKGHVQVVELGRPDDYIRLSIPPGLWYGFECISDIPALIANCTNLPHDPDEGEQAPVDDPGIPYSWGS